MLVHAPLLVHALLLVGPAGAGAEGASATGPLFREVGARALPGVRTTCGGRLGKKDWILEVNGSGVVVEDFDRDGHLDLVVIDGSTEERVRAGEPGLPPRLFLGDGALGFRPAGEGWRMAGGRWGTGGTAGDVNEDGFPDLIVTQWGPDRLLLNQGGHGFREVPPEEAGFVGERWGTSCALADVNGDGHLDLAVICYLAFDFERIPRRGEGARWKGYDVMSGPEGLVPVHDQLYLGRGDGTFREASRECGFVPERAGFGLGVMTFDYERDGDTDLYVSNDSTPNFLWRNDGKGHFTEVGFRAGVSHDAGGREQAGMGIACGDADGDGRDDLFVTNFSGEANAFYRSRSARGFHDAASRAGLVRPSLLRLGWGTGFGDFDLDGDLDLFVLNGHVYPEADRAGTDTSYAQGDQLFVQEGGRFVAQPLSDAPPSVTRAGVAADLDEDGDLDIVALDLDGPVRLLENLAPHGPQHRWLRVRLSERGGRGQGIGARVRAEWKDGAVEGEVRTTAGFQAGSPAEVFLGLGAAPERVRLLVTWPGGEKQVLEDVATDRRIVVRRETPPVAEGEEVDGGDAAGPSGRDRKGG